MPLQTNRTSWRMDTKQKYRSSSLWCRASSFPGNPFAGCHIYVRCYDGLREVQTCPYPKFFDESTLTCKNWRQVTTLKNEIASMTLCRRMFWSNWSKQGVRRIASYGRHLSFRVLLLWSFFFNWRQPCTNAVLLVITLVCPVPYETRKISWESMILGLVGKNWG